MEIKNAHSHVRILRPILISGCPTVQMNGTDAQRIGFCNFSHMLLWTGRQEPVRPGTHQ